MFKTLKTHLYNGPDGYSISFALFCNFSPRACKKVKGQTDIGVSIVPIAQKELRFCSGQSAAERQRSVQNIENTAQSSTVGQMGIKLVLLYSAIFYIELARK